jgi:uncharacterized membrane protein HdeD (DUF308 family)
MILMKCNIDSRGRSIRRNSGIFCCALGVILIACTFWERYFWPFLSLGIVLMLAGIFQVYESRNGWCALRAMGIKTRF